MKTIGIYKITCLITENAYVGQSKHIERRWNEYKNLQCKTQIRLFNSFNKYGIDNHKFEILELCLESELNEREIYWINHFNTFNSPKGFNLRLGGSKGIMSEETKKLISKNSSRHNLGKKASLETREKIRQARLKQADPNLGKKRSQEIKDAFSKQRKGKPQSEAHKKSISEALKKSKKLHDTMATDEYKQKISKAHKGKIVSEETKNKLSASWNHEKHFTPETRKKLSESMRGRTSAMKGRKMSDEAKAKMKKTCELKRLNKKLNEQT